VEVLESIEENLSRKLKSVSEKHKQRSVFKIQKKQYQRSKKKKKKTVAGV
jgi:hypothetical protein